MNTVSIPYTKVEEITFLEEEIDEILAADQVDERIALDYIQQLIKVDIPTAKQLLGNIQLRRCISSIPLADVIPF